MIGHPARKRWSAFGDIEAVHLPACVLYSAAVDEVTSIAQVPRHFGREEITFKTDDNIGLVEMINSSESTIVHSSRIVLMPLRRGECLQHLLHLAGKRRRCDRLSEDGKSCSAIGSAVLKL